MLSRDDILKADDITTREVEVPEWGGTVIVRGLSAKERDNWEASLLRQRGNQMVRDSSNIRAKLVVRVLVDDDGKRLFSDGDAAVLGDKCIAAIDRIFETAAELSAITDEDVEELAKNSEAGQTGDSSSS